MKKNKIKLSDLKVRSIRTDLNNTQDLKGGKLTVGDGVGCPQIGPKAFDYVRCTTVGHFWCHKPSEVYDPACSGDPYVCDSTIVPNPGEL